MNRLSNLAAALVVALVAIVPLGTVAYALEAPSQPQSPIAVVYQEGHGDTTAQSDSGTDVVPRVTWMLAGIAAAAVVMGLLYLFKRRVGGFPKNPSWVAPITIMPSSELPGDRDPHEADTHGHQPAAGH